MSHKVMVDQGREFYNKLMRKQLDVLMYLIYNEVKSTIAERFVRTLKNKISKKMTAPDSHSYLDYLDKLMDEYNNTYHRSIGKKPIHAEYSALSEEFESNLKTPKCRFSDRVNITKYKNIFNKSDTEN